MLQLEYLCLCLSNVYRLDNSKSYERILMKYCRGVDRAPRLHFSGDSESFMDFGSQSRILYH